MRIAKTTPEVGQATSAAARKDALLRHWNNYELRQSYIPSRHSSFLCRALSGYNNVLARGFILVIVAVFALRLPFLNQAIQGDDVFYLTGARHAQIEPLHPKNVEFPLSGKMVSMQGHTHPPFNVWYLGLILLLVGDVREPAFHLAYIPFSLMAALSCYALARRWTPRPLAATMLFIATPAFVINGTSLEADLPLLGLWMASMACFISASEQRSPGRLAGAMILMALAAMDAYQSVLLLPICGLYLWCFSNRWAPAWAALLTTPLIITLYQAFERMTTKAVPLAALAGNFQKYALQTLHNKMFNAAALTIHLGASVSSFTLGFFVSRIALPFLLGVTLLAFCIWTMRRSEPERRFLAGWILIYFTAALVLFFAGSARYLLPLAAPLAILLSRLPYPRILTWAVAANLVVSLALASANYQHWEAYRSIAKEFESQTKDKRVWVNNDWLRHYFEANGALPILESQSVQPGEIVVSSKLGYPVPFATGGGTRVAMREWQVKPSLPFQLIGLDAHSGYSTVEKGFESFGLVVEKPVDIVTAEIIVEKKASLSYVNMGAPESESQIAGGFYHIEDGRWRWMSGKGTVLLKREPNQTEIALSYALPDILPGKNIELFVDGQLVHQVTLKGPGPGQIKAHLPPFTTPQISVSVTIDKVFSPPNDQRNLGLIVQSIRLLQN